MDNKRKIIPTIKITLIFGIFLLFINLVFAEPTNSWLKATIENKIIEKINIDSTKKSDKVKTYFLKGNEFFAKGSYPKAITYLEKTLQLGLDSAEVYNNLGIAYRKLGNYSKAISALEKAIQLKPDFVEAYSNLGSAYIYFGDYQQAITILEKAIQIDPSFAGAYYNFGFVYTKFGNFQKAAHYLEKAIQIDPNYAEAYNNLAFTYMKLGDYQKAKESTEKAKTLFQKQGNKQGITAVENIEMMLKKAKKLDSKEEKSDDAKAKEYLLKGSNFFDNKDYNRAITYYQKAIKIDPNFVEAYNNLGIVYEKIGDYEKAISYFKKVIEIDHQYIEAYTYIASIYIRLEDYQKALTYSKKAYQMKPDNVNNNIAVYLALGTAYGGLRDYINAKKYYQKARELCEQQGNQKCVASTKKMEVMMESRIGPDAIFYLRTPPEKSP